MAFNAYGTGAGQALQVADAARQRQLAAAARPKAPSLADLLNQQYAAAGNRAAPQAGRTQLGGPSMVDTTRADQFRQGEVDLARQLAAISSGQQQGAGEMAARRQVSNALGQAYGTATMARGNAAAGGARAAARAAGTIGLAGAGIAKEAALGDQAAARQQLAAVLGQGRSGDLSTASQNAAAQNATTLAQGQMDQQTALANMEAQLRSRGMNDQQIAQILGMMQSQSQFDQQLYASQHPTWQQMLGGVVGQAGQILGAL